MTTEPTPEAQVAPLAITTGPVEVPQEAPGTRTAFTLPGDDEMILWAVKPKTVLLLHVSEFLAAAEARPDDGNIAMEAYRTFINRCLDPASADLLWGRLNDNDDTLDAPDLAAMVSTFMERWSGRPTGPLSGRSPLQRGTGRASTGRKPSKGKTRKS